MELALFKTLWGHDGGLDHAVHLCKEAGFQGIEGPAPLESGELEVFLNTLEEAGLEWIAEVSTCTPPGLYVPLPGCSVEQHLRSLEDGVVRSLEGSPRFINTMAGYDAWSFSDALRFFESVVGLQEKHGIVISVETHRGRPTFSPWLTRDLLVVVPEHAADLAAHERWWACVWDSMADRGFTRFTMTPEFGPDGYLQCEPFTRKPVADLWEVNRWIGLRQREHFHRQFSTPPPP